MVGTDSPGATAQVARTAPAHRHRGHPTRVSLASRPPVVRITSSTEAFSDPLLAVTEGP